MTDTNHRPIATVDANVPRFNHTLVAVLTTTAFLLQAPWLVAVTFAVLALSSVGGPRWAPFTRLYVDLIRPRIQPDGPTELEAAAPPRFAQMLGALLTGAATLAFLLGAAGVGWALALVVAALAAFAATTRICVGCMLYGRLARR